ncbi:MAG TPA: SelA-like pyridoxal phosphate-dependent enzyme, partial [Pantoea sp.]|nr:SelA-like pyridoxal phosphate-dependent enzyme [Pantoea sp.]
EIAFDEATIQQRTGDLVQALKKGDTAIYFRGYKANEGIIEADVRSVSADQLQTIFARIQALLTGEKNA